MFRYTGLHGFLIWFHLLLFTMWLGADMGVYYAHRFILLRERSVDARLVAAQIMRGIDLLPRLAMALFLASGTTLIAVDPLGHRFAGAPLAAVWVGTTGWVAVTVYLFVRGDPATGRLHRAVATVDRYGRVVLAVGLIGVATYTLAAPHPFGVNTNPRWLGAKVLLYALCILLALGIEANLRPFGAAFTELVTTGSSPDVEHRLRRSLRRCIPYVYLLWACVAAAALLGVMKPGAHIPGS